MNFKVGDLVSRNSHNNDIVKVNKFENDDNEIIERSIGFLNIDREN